jgi:hypothetical protein
MPGHDQLSAKGGDHGTVIGAQTQGWDSKLNAVCRTALGRQAKAVEPFGRRRRQPL